MTWPDFKGTFKIQETKPDLFYSAYFLLEILPSSNSAWFELTSNTLYREVTEFQRKEDRIDIFSIVVVLGSMFQVCDAVGRKKTEELIFVKK